VVYFNSTIFLAWTKSPACISLTKTKAPQ